MLNPPIDGNALLKTPLTTRGIFRMADSALYTGANWFFFSKVVEFSPWLIGLVATYNLSSYYGYKFLQDFSMRKREEAHNTYQTKPDANPLLVARNELLINTDRTFKEVGEQARQKRALNDFATSAMLCMMVGAGSGVALMGTAVVLFNLYYNFSTDPNSALGKYGSQSVLGKYTNVALYLTTFALAVNPATMMWASLAIIALKAINIYEYDQNAGTKAYGKVYRQLIEEAKGRGEDVVEKYNLRMGKVDTVKFFNFRLEERDKAMFLESFQFNDSSNVNEYDAEHSKDSPYFFPAIRTTDNFPDFVPDKVIATLNVAIERIFLHNDNEVPPRFISTEMRVQALRNIIDHQRDVLAETLKSQPTARDAQLDEFMRICNERVEKLEEFCCQYLETIPERDYYSLLMLSLKRPAEINQAIEDGDLNPQLPRISKMEMFYLPEWMCGQGPGRLGENAGVDLHGIEMVDYLIDIIDRFEGFHYWPAIVNLPFSSLASWLFGLTHPYLQIENKGKSPSGNGNTIFDIKPNPTYNLVSEDILKSMAAYYVCASKALGINKIKLEHDSNRLRRWVKRYGDAYGVETRFATGDRGMIYEWDTIHTTSEDDSRAQAMNIQVEEIDNPRALPHDHRECEDYNQYILADILRIATSLPHAPPLDDDTGKMVFH